MAEPFALDDPPKSDANEDASTDVDGKIQCPECDKTFKPSGLQRHITMAHRGGISDRQPNAPRANTKSAIIEARWADFQRGAALLVSLACTQCANALAEDAERDAIALAQYCQNKPKFRKQVEDFLTTADFLLLVGAFGGTAQKMISHHSIAKRIPGITPTINPEHSSHDPASRMMDFMGSMPPEQRHAMFDRAMEAREQARQQQEAFTQSQQTPAPAEDTGAGGEPVPDTTTLTEHDRQIREAMNSGTEFMETVGTLGG